VRPEVGPDPRAVRVVADLRRISVQSVLPRHLGDGVNGLVHLLRQGERRARADVVLGGEAGVSLDAGNVRDGRALRFELNAKRTE
jgi:hypothetical protein